MKFISAFLLLAISAFAQLPSGFKIISASSRQVQLSWVGSQQVSVERKTQTGSYRALSATATTPYTDTSITGWETYTYRISVGAASSAEFTVGPPPFGFNTVVPSPSTDFAEVKLGRGTRMIVDGNSDPMIAYVRSDQNNPREVNNGVYFIRWDRLNYKWTNPIKLLTVERYTNKTRVGFARDAASGALAVATDNNATGAIDLFYSSNTGVSWSRSTLTPTGDSIKEPHLAIANGTGYLLYLQGSNLRLRRGPISSAVNSWAISSPVPGDPDVYPFFDLESDSSGNVFYAYAAAESTTILYLAKVDGSRSVVERDILGDTNGIALTFTGNNPRILVDAGFDNRFFYGENNWFYRSNDAGATWSRRVLIPQDGGNGMGWPFALTVDSKGNGSVVAPITGGNNGDTSCGGPKLSRSSDLVNWKTCAPQGTRQINQEPDSPDMQLGNGEELLILYDQTQRAGADIAAGLVFWRENIFGSAAVPAISSGGVVNLASYLPSLSPGSLVSIFGSNLSSSSGGASSVPLPTSVVATSVLVNGRSAPLFYVSPTQINFQMPYETAIGAASVVVQTSGTASNPSNITVNPTSPGLLVYGNNRLVAVNQDGSINGAESGEAAGRTVVIYGVGLGALDNAVASGTAASAAPLSRPRAASSLTIGGRAANIVFLGLTPGSVGLVQINATVPALTPGNYPVILTVGGVTSNNPLFTVR